MRLQAALLVSIVLLLNIYASMTEGKQIGYDKEVDEGECTKTYTTHKEVTTFRMVGKTTKVGWYVHMSSKHIAYHLGKQLLKTDNVPQKTLERLCLRVDANGIVSYYNKKKTLVTCSYSYLENVYCTTKKAPSDHHLAGKFKATLAWSDKSGDNLIVVLCSPQAKEKYWMMGSTSEKLDSNVKSEVLMALKGLGFDDKKVLYQDRANCHEGNKPRSLWSTLTLGVFDEDEETDD